MHTPDEIREELIHHPRNLGIEYKPGPHTYTRFYEDGGSEKFNGITSLLKKYSPFEAKKIKYGIVKSKKPEYAHLNSFEDVEAEWEEARQAGTDMHDELELWGVEGVMPEKPAALKALQYFEDHNLTPIVFEHTTFCDTLKRATPMDLGLVDQYGRFIPADYKTSKEIKHSHYEYKGNKKKMEYPLTHLPTSNFYSYSLQLAFEIHWLNSYYDLSFPITPYGLIFHVRDGELEVYRSLPMQQEIRMIYEWEEKTN